MDVLLALGTAKGLFLARSRDDRKAWDVSGPHLAMNGVYSVCIDTRGGTPRLLAGVDHSHFGPSITISDDLGATWQEPDEAPVAFPEDVDASLTRVWQLTPGAGNRIYAGTEPAALFVSEDGGTSFELVRPLWDHPHRENWGAGFGGQAFHTILPHPDDADSVLA